MSAAPALRSPEIRERLAHICHALSDETRIRIVEKLLGGERCVCDLTDSLEAGQSRLSFHLKTLKDAGLVTDRRHGRWVYYALDPATLSSLCRLLSAVQESVVRATDGCCSRSATATSLPSRDTTGRDTAG